MIQTFPTIILIIVLFVIAVALELTAQKNDDLSLHKVANWYCYTACAFLYSYIAYLLIIHYLIPLFRWF